MKIGIDGIGLISPWGNELSQFLEGYGKKEKAFSPIERFESKDIAAKSVAFVKEFDPKKYIEPKTVRKYDQFSRLGIAVAKEAIALSPDKWTKEELEDMGIVMTCETQSMITCEYLDELVREGPDMVSPKLFSVAAANSANCNISMETGVLGPSVSVSSKFSAGFLSVFTGGNLIRAGQVEHCLSGSIDYLSQVVMEAYTRMGCYKVNPGDQEGFIPGEGSAAVILSGSRGRYGSILGMGYQCSSQQNYRWPKDSSTQAEVIRKAIGSHKVDKIQLAANGHGPVDELEQNALKEVFGEGRPEEVRLKDLIGEFSAAPLFQLIAACAEPAGTKTLISVLSPGGVHGALLVEAGGWRN